MAGLEGRTLDRYELEKLLGRGGMADVYLGRDSQFDRDIAIKIFKREDEDLLRRFVREAHLMASLNNAHLMPVYDAGTAQLDGSKVYYIAMPYMEGGTLRNRIRKAPLSPKVVCRYMRDIADALDYMHQQGIIHRDIKSSNVLLDAEGRCYLSDFGIARTTSTDTQMTSTGSVLGTVDYIAPELFETAQRANARSDLYSLGVLLFEMVTGELPFVGESQIAVIAMHASKRPPSPRSIIPSLSPAVERVVYKALEKKPELRYGSAKEMANAFCQAVNNPAAFMAQQQEEEVLWNQETRQVSGERQNPQVTRSQPMYLPSATHSAQATGSIDAYMSNQQSTQLPAYTSSFEALTERQRRRRSVARTQTTIIAVLAVVALLAVLVPIGYVLFAHPYSQPQLSSANLTATTQAQINATNQQNARNASSTAVVGSTSTAQANVTATAIAGNTATAQAKASATQQAKDQTATAVVAPTATAQANASATAGVLPTATAGNPVYSDALNSGTNPATQNANWDTSDHCAFQADGYHVITDNGVLGSGNFKGCHEAELQYQNFAASVDMTIKNGHSGGIFFRVATSFGGPYAGYLFEVDAGGQYKISSADNFSSSTTITTLQQWTASDALKKNPNTKNTLTVIAQADTLNFYANGTFLVTIKDSGHMNSGNIAFLATTTTQAPNADVIYSNIKIYTLS